MTKHLQVCMPTAVSVACGKTVIKRQASWLACMLTLYANHVVPKALSKQFTHDSQHIATTPVFFSNTLACPYGRLPRRGSMVMSQFLRCYDRPYLYVEHGPLHAFQRTDVCTPFAPVYDCKERAMPVRLPNTPSHAYSLASGLLPSCLQQNFSARNSVTTYSLQRTKHCIKSYIHYYTDACTLSRYNYQCCTSEASTALMCGAKRTRNLQTKPKTHQPPLKSGAKISTSAN